MAFKDIPVGKRLAIGFGSVLGLMGLMSVAAFIRLHEVDSLNAEVQASEHQATLADQWNGQTQVNLARALAIAKSGGNADLQAHVDPLIKETSARISALQKELEATRLNDNEREQLAVIATARKTYVDIRTVIFKGIKEQDATVAARVDAEMLPAAQAYLSAMDKLSTILDEEAATLAAKGHAMLELTRKLLVASAALAIALGAFIAWSLTRSITVPMRRVIDTAQHIAEGDLSTEVRVSRDDEIGQLQRAMLKMRDNLHGMVSGIRSSTDGITTASSEIAIGSQDLSARTEQTASNLQEAASSMEQLTGTVRQTADSARTANQLAATAAEAARKGGDVVGEVVSNMEGIATASRKIADIIGVIDGIAFQTNILALNAAVEAARAGEQGRGFAVVAAEVRSLAQRSASAAREIKTLIGASVEQVESGSRLVETAGQSMTDIVGSVQRVSDIIGEISAAAAEQSDGIAQVNGAVTQLDQMTQQNAALVEESAAAAESLKDQAQRLAQVVSRFELGSGPAGSPVSPSPARSTHTPGKVSAPALAKPATPKPAASPRPVAAARPAPAPAPRPAVAETAGSDADWETF
ncbi:methyl-accepting chemotaxis protein [Ideonella margarita]|uniref:Methyl-accepting chemotaxis protein n=1 Tax=Ideonella margarita TaxID=2984191 RepID=A0ABU9C6X9_9BURK